MLQAEPRSGVGISRRGHAATRVLEQFHPKHRKGQAKGEKAAHMVAPKAH